MKLSLQVARCLFVVVAVFSGAAAMSQESGDGLVKVRGRGAGMDKTEALKDAYRDAIESAVGLYVDAEQVVKNEDLVKDQILTHSNAYIAKYSVVKEEVSDKGLVTVTILADVRKRDLVKKINDLMPAQKTDLSSVSKNLHAQIVTDLKANDDALSIIKNELSNLSPVKQIMKATLAATTPVVEPVGDDPSSVRLWYPVKIEVDVEKYYKEFVPRWERILDQIKVAPLKRLDLANNSQLIKLYNNALAQKYGTVRKQKSGVMTRCDAPRSDFFGNSFSEYGIALNEEYKGVAFLDTKIHGKDYMISGFPHLPFETEYDVMEKSRPINPAGFIRHLGNRYWHDNTDFNIPEDCAFYVGLVCTALGRTLSGRTYQIPYNCVKEIIAWQKQLVGEEEDRKTVSFELVFADLKGDEVAGCSFSVRNEDVLNCGCVSLKDKEVFDEKGGTRLWLITPLVGGFAKSYVKWVCVDLPKDDVAKIASATIKIEE